MLTQKELKSFLRYDQITGTFCWIRILKNCTSVSVGSIAGSLNNTGYINIIINRKSYRSHRLAFLYMTGSIPEFIDHIDHNRSNNSWDNIIEATKISNGRNQSMRKSLAPASGIYGVRYSKQLKKWLARIIVNSEQIHLGVFKSKDNAVTVRKAAEGWYGFHENHGS